MASRLREDLLGRRLRFCGHDEKARGQIEISAIAKRLLLAQKRACGAERGDTHRTSCGGYVGVSRIEEIYGVLHLHTGAAIRGEKRVYLIRFSSSNGSTHRVRHAKLKVAPLIAERVLNHAQEKIPASSGEYVFVRDAAGAWTYESKFRPADVFAAGFPSTSNWKAGRLLRPRAQDGGAVGVFRRSAPGEWEYLAKLVPSSGQLTQRIADSSGNRVVAQGTDAVYVWDLPVGFSQPALHRDDFQDGDAADWLPQAGSDFAVVTGTQSLVYRQRSLAGNATSLLSASAWSNQSIQADVKPTEFSGR